eukprot:g78075.t1
MADETFFDPTASAHDELFLFHHASKHMWVGENVTWYWQSEMDIPAQFQQLGHQAGNIEPSPMFPVADAELVKASWERVLEWDFESFQGYHEAPGVAVTKNAKQRLMQAVMMSHQWQKVPIDQTNT